MCRPFASTKVYLWPGCSEMDEHFISGRQCVKRYERSAAHLIVYKVTASLSFISFKKIKQQHILHALYWNVN